MTVIGDVIDLVTPTSPASAPLRAKINVRIDAGLMPQSWAPSSCWITERIALPSVVRRKNDDQHGADGKGDRRRQQRPGSHPYAEDLDRVAADAQAQRLDRIAPHEQAIDHERHAEHQQQAEQHPLARRACGRRAASA